MDLGSTYASNKGPPKSTETYARSPGHSEAARGERRRTERWRAGNHRAQLAVGDGAAVALTQRPGENTPDAGGGSVMVRVEDVNTHHERALQRGARILESPADHPYGERQYTAEDNAGHRWTFSQSIADVAPEDWGATSGAQLTGTDAKITERSA